MHIHIPSVSEATDPKGSRFKVFNIYINGIYHCSLRYSQLLDLHNDVKSKHKMEGIVDFPPKILRISDDELDYRRILLERYLHCLVQDRDIGESDLLVDYMLTAQKVSCGVAESSVKLEVFLCNGKSKEITCLSHDRTSHVLIATCEAIGIESEYACYFGLFVEFTKRGEEEWKVLRYCVDMESPYLSLYSATRNDVYSFRLSIRKWYFNKLYTSKLLASKTCLNMLYIEALDMLEGGKSKEVPEEDKERLLSMKKSRKEFVNKCNELPLFNEVACFPITVGEKRTHCIARVSGKYVEIFENEAVGKSKIYPISKLRCWKVGIFRISKQHFFAYEFEYQQQKFMWVTLRGFSTILLTQCIGQAVNEYVLTAKKKEPVLTSRTRAPPVSLSPLKFTNGPPVGIDLTMAVETPISKEPDYSSDESCDLGGDDESTANGTEKNDTDKTAPVKETTESSEQDNPSPSTQRDSRPSPSTNASGQASYKKQRKPRKKKDPSNDETLIFNNTFLDDSDL